MSVLDTLITDRTQADVTRWQTLHDKGWSGMTTEEKTEWLAGMKGSYNAADLNRVTAAMEYLRDRLEGYGYAVDYQPIEIPRENGSGSRLPEGYTELEYIESSGTQWIDTGISGKST